MQNSAKQLPTSFVKSNQKQQQQQHNEQAAVKINQGQNQPSIAILSSNCCTASVDMNLSSNSIDTTPNTNITTTTTASDGTIMEERRVGKRFIIKKAYPQLTTLAAVTTPKTTQQQPQEHNHHQHQQHQQQQQLPESKTQQTESLEQNIVLKNRDIITANNDETLLPNLLNKDTTTWTATKSNSYSFQTTEPPVDKEKVEVDSSLPSVILDNGERKIGKSSSFSFLRF